jgi:pimeloyl-ACP methyl ester carboxylesterase
MQNFFSGQFRMFDYGPWQNMKIYNSTQPPEYDLRKITAPIYLQAGTQDLIVGIKDVERLCSILPNCKESMIVTNYNHFDFTYGKNARRDVYERILKHMMNRDEN